MMWDVTHVQHNEIIPSLLVGESVLDTALSMYFGYSVVGVNQSHAEKQLKD